MFTPPPTVHKKKVPLPPPPPKITPTLKIETVPKPPIIFEKVVNNIVKSDLEVELSAPETVGESAPAVDIIVPEEPVESSPLSTAERMPIYGDCDLDMEELSRRKCTEKNLLKHIYANIKYPPEARRMGAEGTVFVSFIVNKSGELEDVRVLRDIGFGCGKEVMKCIRSLNTFLPGKQNGRPVRVIYRIPVKFKLE